MYDGNAKQFMDKKKIFFFDEKGTRVRFAFKVEEGIIWRCLPGARLADMMPIVRCIGSLLLFQVLFLLACQSQMFDRLFLCFVIGLGDSG